MDESERSQALEVHRKRHVHFFYLGFTQKFNERHWSALSDEADILRRRIFDHASEPWEGLNTPLQYDLVQIAEHWGKIAHADDDGHVPACPLSYTPEEAERINKLDDLHREADGDMERVNELLGIASDGWTLNERFEIVQNNAAEIKGNALASVDDDPWLDEMIERHWPFDDFDEDE
jgi:hypothetical protein